MSPERDLLWLLAAWGSGLVLYAALRGLEELVTRWGRRRRSRGWRDYMMARALWRPTKGKLSIPLWFDWGSGRRFRALVQDLTFNPTLVRLGPAARRQPHHRHLRAFNPTLVRLGPGARRGHAGHRPCFQSHFGSIGAWDQARSLPDCDLLSIPLWFDWGPSPVDPRRPITTLSIPLWFDWGPRRCPRLSPIRHRLSIPLWFDWGNPRAIDIQVLGRPFQSHFGSIGAYHSSADLVFVSHFQSHFGSIGARLAVAPRSPLPRFQSHFGSIGARLPSPLGGG